MSEQGSFILCRLFVFSVFSRVPSSTFSVMSRIVAQDGFIGLFAGRSLSWLIVRLSIQITRNHSPLPLCQVSSPGWSKWPQPAPLWSAATSLERPFSVNTTKKGHSGLCNPAIPDRFPAIYLQSKPDDSYLQNVPGRKRPMVPNLKTQEENQAKNTYIRNTKHHRWSNFIFTAFC